MSMLTTRDAGLLESVLDGELTCAAGDGPAVWMFAMRCCGGNQVFTCQEHHDLLIEYLDQNRKAHPGVYCKCCGKNFEAPASVDVFVRVVGPL